jgi:hypothetical protein
MTNNKKRLRETGRFPVVQSNARSVAEIPVEEGAQLRNLVMASISSGMSSGCT